MWSVTAKRMISWLALKWRNGMRFVIRRRWPGTPLVSSEVPLTTPHGLDTYKRWTSYWG